MSSCSSKTPGPWPYLVACALLSVLVRLSNAPYHLAGPIGSDGARALLGAELFIRGVEGLDPLWAPLYPLLSVGFGRLFSDPRLGAIGLNLLASAALPFLTYLLGRKCLDARAGAFAAAAVSVWGGMVSLSLRVYPETLYIAFVLGAWLALWGLAQDPTARRGLLCGGLLGIAYWFRPEALLLAVVAGVWAIWRSSISESGPRSAATGLVVVATAFAVAAPYLVFLRLELGHWTLSGKTGYNLLLGDAADDASSRDVTIWALTPEGDGVLGYRAMRTHSLPGLLLSKPGEMARRYLRNSLVLAFTMLQLLGVPVLLLMVAGVVGRWVRGERAAILFLSAPLVVLTVVPFFFVAPRFLLVCLPFLFLFAGAGLSAASRILFREERRGPVPRGGSSGSSQAVRIGRGLVLACLMLLPLVPHVLLATTVARQGWQALARARPPFPEARAAGDWLAKNSAPKDRTTNIWVAYRARRPWQLVPHGEAAPVLTYLRRTRTRFLVVDRRMAREGYLPQSSRSFLPWLDGEPPPPGVTEVFRHAPGTPEELRIYELSAR